MASKIKVDQLETADGSGTIALQNQLSGMTTASLPALGSAQMPTGSVLQVVSANGGSAVTSTNTGAFVDTGLTAAITPSATSSKILVLVDQHLTSSAEGYWVGFGIYRGSSSIKGTSYLIRSGASHLRVQVSYNYLDSPSTTSATTYKTMFRATSGEAVANDNSAPSTITLIEIAG